MFKNNDELKQKLKDFWQNEIEEISQNKIRVFALIFSVFIAVALMFTEDSGEKIDIGNSEKLEESAEITPKKNSDDDEKSNKKVISVKKAENKTDREKIVAVIGENSEELYIGDPFQSSEEKPVYIKQETSKIENIPQQIPVIPSQAPKIFVQNSELPPIPEMSVDLPPIPSAVPVKLTENIISTAEFILTGTAINLDKKATVVKKISATQGKNEHEENMLLVVGDVLNGRKILDITESTVIFDDGNNIHSSYLDNNIFIDAESEDTKINDITENEQESPNKNNFSIEVVETENIEPVEKNREIIPNTPQDFIEFSSEIIINTDVAGDDTNTVTNSASSDDFSINGQAQTFLASDSSP